MGANSSKISDLPKNEYLKRLSGPEAISENDPFWNQLFSFSFSAPTSSTELKLLEEATISVCKSLVENNPRTGNLAALTKVFLARTRELRLSAECQNHIFIWQTHNALFIICCLLKVFICEMSEEELQLHFTYEEKLPGTYSSDSEDLLEELLCSLIQLITDTPLLDITYEISVEAISAMIVFLSCQLFHKEVLRQSISHKYLMQGPCLPYTSKLVKTLLYNFIRQEKPPPPGTHVFPQQSDGGGRAVWTGVRSSNWSLDRLHARRSGQQSRLSRTYFPSGQPESPAAVGAGEPDGCPRHPLWTEGEKRQLLSAGKVQGYDGYYVLSVEQYPELADSANNIQFLRQSEIGKR